MRASAANVAEADYIHCTSGRCFIEPPLFSKTEIELFTNQWITSKLNWIWPSCSNKKMILNSPPPRLLIYERPSKTLAREGFVPFGSLHRFVKKLRSNCFIWTVHAWADFEKIVQFLHETDNEIQNKHVYLVLTMMMLALQQTKSGSKGNDSRGMSRTIC